MAAVFLTHLLYQESTPTEVRVALIIAIGTVGAAIIAFLQNLYNNRRTNEQRETGDYYQKTFLELRQDKIELNAEKEALEQENRNLEAQLQKQKIDHQADKRLLIRERDAYTVYAAALRRVARKYAPKDYKLPELDTNESNTPEKIQ